MRAARDQWDKARQALPDAFGPATRILRAWGFTRAESATVLGVPERTFYDTLRDPDRLAAANRSWSPGLIERVSYVLGIYKALHTLFPDPAMADGWMNQPNDGAPFGGLPPKNRILAGQVADLYETRRYLDAWQQTFYG